MRRTGFKKPTYNEAIKRLKVKSKKRISTKTNVSKKKPVKVKIKPLKAKLWELCKQIIRLKYKNPNNTWNCSLAY